MAFHYSGLIEASFIKDFIVVWIEMYTERKFGEKAEVLHFMKSDVASRLENLMFLIIIFYCNEI